MSQTRVCSDCGEEFPVDQMYYSDQGQLICRQCESAADVASGFRNSYIGMATGAFSLSLVSICFNIFMLPSVLAVVGGIHTFRFPNQLDSEDQKALESLWWVPILAGLAVFIGRGRTFMSALAMVGLFV